jgi:hypothetical protein
MKPTARFMLCLLITRKNWKGDATTRACWWRKQTISSGYGTRGIFTNSHKLRVLEFAQYGVKVPVSATFASVTSTFLHPPLFRVAASLKLEAALEA